MITNIQNRDTYVHMIPFRDLGLTSSGGTITIAEKMGVNRMGKRERREKGRTGCTSSLNCRLNPTIVVQDFVLLLLMLVLTEYDRRYPVNGHLLLVREVALQPRLDRATLRGVMESKGPAALRSHQHRGQATTA